MVRGFRIFFPFPLSLGSSQTPFKSAMKDVDIEVC